MFTISDIMKYLDGNPTAYHSEASAQYYNGKLEANLSSEYTALIKEAARCNRYSNDLIYDIEAINHALETFDPDNDLPVFAIGFRKDGVDGNGFIMSSVSNDGRGSLYDIYKLYFAVYFVEIKEDEGFPGFYKVETKGYHV